MTDTPKPDKCSNCGATVQSYWMCDKEGDEIHCSECFDKHPCGKGDHGEGCATLCVTEASQ
jgi:hypothetical protein